jgi:hypothetical protein
MPRATLPATLPAIPRARRRSPAIALATALVVLAACASGGGARAGGDAPLGGSRIITTAEIRAAAMPSVLEVVSALRPQWLRGQGTDAPGGDAAVRVYVGNRRAAAGLAALRDMRPAGISRIEFVDPAAATARWGPDHGRGAIVVVTGRR